MLSPTNYLIPLKKVESFQVIENRPDCRTPQDQRIQEVIRPAMLVVSSSGQQFLIYQND